MAKRVDEGVDVLVCHLGWSRRVCTLVEFLTICWYETEVPDKHNWPNFCDGRFACIEERATGSPTEY